MKKEQEARKIAFDILLEVRNGKRLDFALEKLSKLDEMDKSFAHMIVMSAIRHHGQIDVIIKTLVDKRIPKKNVTILLWMGITQLLYMNIAEHAAINTTVELAKTVKMLPYTKFINAVLRNIQRQKDSFSPCESENLPNWLKTKTDFNKEQLQSIAKSIINQPALYLTIKENPEQWAKENGGEFIVGNSVRMQAQKISEIPGYEEGKWWVQDFSASIPANLFTMPLSGKKVADFCAAPGGKTAQLIAKGANVTAFDISEKRTEIMKQNFARLNMNAEIIVSDASKYLGTNPIFFDAILLDAPCSAIGTMRRNPDILLSPSPALPLKEQEELLESAFKHLNRGGEIVYSVCSFLPQEGEEQIEKFLYKHKDAEIIPVNLAKEITYKNYMRITPDYMAEHGGVDGFFAAIIKKL